MTKERKKRAKKKELFSYNNAIILLILLAIFVVTKTIVTSSRPVSLFEDATTNLVKEAEFVLYTLTDGNAEIGLLGSNGLDEAKIEYLDQMDYDEVKKVLGVNNDFCVFFEDINGNIIKIDDVNLGIGSDKIHINGNPCE